MSKCYKNGNPTINIPAAPTLVEDREIERQRDGENDGSRLFPNLYKVLVSISLGGASLDDC